MSNSLAFGENIPSRGDMYFRVKKKGDQIQFRLAQDPVYVGKHFVQKENGWDVLPCPRINAQEECDMCNTFFQMKAESKKLKDVDAEKAKEIDKEARNFACATTFYFPVLNRDTESFVILQTTGGVRNKINAQHEAGIDVFKKDWILRNTGSDNPQEIYSLIPVDSADTKEFSEKEVEEFEKAKAYDLLQINDGASQSDEIE